MELLHLFSIPRNRSAKEAKKARYLVPAWKYHADQKYLYRLDLHFPHRPLPPCHPPAHSLHTHKPRLVHVLCTVRRDLFSYGEVAGSSITQHLLIILSFWQDYSYVGKCTAYMSCLLSTWAVLWPQPSRLLVINWYYRFLVLPCQVLSRFPCCVRFVSLLIPLIIRHQSSSATGNNSLLPSPLPSSHHPRTTYRAWTIRNAIPHIFRILTSS